MDFFILLSASKTILIKTLAEKPDIFVIIYPNNILIYTKNASLDYIKNAWFIIKQLRDQDQFINPKNYYFYQEKIYFLGYIISY